MDHLGNKIMAENGRMRTTLLLLAVVAVCVLNCFSGFADAGKESNSFKGVFHFGEGGATAYTDEDLARIEPCPFRVVSGSENKVDWGNWLTIQFWECHGHNRWDPFRSPDLVRFLSKTGCDIVTDIRDNESINPFARVPLEILGEDGRGVDRFGSEWVRRTGRGLITSSLWMTDAGGCDGAVFTGLGTDKRLPATHSSICYSSPNTFYWAARKIKGLNEAFQNTAIGPDGKLYGYFLKETSRHYYLRSTPTQFYFSCYCQYCQREFQRYVRKKYVSLEKLSGVYGRNYYKWEDIELPVPEMRLYEAQKFYDFIKFREWIRMENGDKLWKRLGLTNIVNEGTFQFASWYISPFTGTNAYLAALNLDIGYLNLFQGFAPCDAIAAMVDSVFRDSPGKKAIAEWGGGPSLYLQRPGTFRRKIGEHFGHVTNMRGVATMGWDTMIRSLVGYYYDPKWSPWVAQDIAWWSNFGELQHWLFKDMKTAMPEIASYYARPSVLFEAIEHAHPEGIFPERSKAWCWNAMMFWQSQLPVHILHPEQVEQGDLDKYNVLYCLYGPRNTPETLDQIRKFYDGGGYVYGSFDALTWTITEEDWSLFEHVFKCEKIEAPWSPVAGPKILRHEPGFQQRIYRWNSSCKEPLGYYEITAAHPALPPVGTKLPVTSGIRVVKPLSGAKVHALYKGQPCIVSSERSLFVGTDIVSDLAHCAPEDYKSLSEPWQLNYPSLPGEEFRKMLKVFSGFAEYAGVKTPFDVFMDGRRAININTGTLTKADGTSLYLLSNNENIAGKYEVRFAMKAVWKAVELVSEKVLELENGKASLQIPGYGFAMILVAEASAAEKAMLIQKEVNRNAENSVDEIEKLSRHFFIQAEAAEEYTGLGYPLNWGRENPFAFHMHAQAILVVPDSASKADLELAQKIRQFLKEYPYLIGAGWRRAAEAGKKPRATLGLEIPIKKAGEVTDQELQTRNLLIIGNSQENALAFRCLPGGALQDKSLDNLFVSHMPNANEAGGNIFVIGGSPQDRRQAFEKFTDWAWIWFDSLLSPVPPEKVLDIVKNSYQGNGWDILSATSEKVTVKKAGLTQSCFIYCHSFSDVGRACEEFMEGVEKGSAMVVACDNPDSRGHFVNRLMESGLVQKAPWPFSRESGTLTTKAGKEFEMKFIESDRAGLLE